jgi:hypothetical protein
MFMKYLILAFLIVFSIEVAAQKRLELLETNIPAKNFVPYGNSYLWTKNWWLTNGILVDTAKGGNAIARKSKLDKSSIDSLGKQFRKLLSPKLVRFGNLRPRIIFYKQTSQAPFITASIYEIGDSSVQLLAVYKIQFGVGEHNQMTDVLDIRIMEPKQVKPISYKSAMDLYSRIPINSEKEITPPGVEN